MATEKLYECGYLNTMVAIYSNNHVMLNTMSPNLEDRMCFSALPKYLKTMKKIRFLTF